MKSTLTDAVRKKLLNKGLGASFCLVPFTSLIIEPDGSVGCCRQKGSDFPVGNLHENSLEEIWNGPFLRNWRREFLHGSPAICRNEIRRNSCNLCPEYNSLLEQAEFKVTQTSLPIRIGLNLNGKCNLRCQMCVVWRKPDGLLEKLNVLDKIEPYVAGLKEVELHSGEPFIQKDTYRLIDWIGKRNPSCLWTITTNGHWKLTQRIKDHLDKIRFKNLILSLDSLSKGSYARIRKNGRLNVVLDNLARLREYESGRLRRGLHPLNLRVNFLIQRENWREVKQIAEFERQEGLPCFRTLLIEPKEYSLLTLSTETRMAVLSFYEKSLSPEDLKGAARIVLPIIDSLPKIDQIPHWERLHAVFLPEVANP